MKYYEENAIPATYAQLKEAYLKMGLQVQELPITYSSSPVKIMHDGVPYVMNCYHDLEGVSTEAAKFYILLERHHQDIKKLFEAWQSQCDEDLMVMSGGGLQLQAFFTTKKSYQGILYLSHINDGRFDEIEKILKDKKIPFKPYEDSIKNFSGPYTLITKDPWLTSLPDVENIKIRCEKTHVYRPVKSKSLKNK